MSTTASSTGLVRVHRPPARQIARAFTAMAVAVVAGCGGPRVIPDGLLISNVTLIDGTDAGARPGMSVAVADGRIVAVSRSDDLVAGPEASEIDGSGMFLTPGLWDMHVHLALYEETSFPLFLANGVTTIREVGGGLQRNIRLRRASAEGELLGPTVLMAGPTLDSEIMSRAVTGTVDAPVAIPDSATAVAVVDSLARAGVDLIKVHAATPRSAYFAALRAARRHGLHVAGHIPDSVMPREAIGAGQRTIEHGSRHPFANSPRGRELTNWMLGTMQRYLDTAGARVRPLGLGLARWAADDSAQQTFDPALARAFAEYAARKPVWFDPTLVIYQVALRNNEPGIRDLPETKYAPAAVREWQELPPPKPNPTEAEIEDGRQRWAAALASFAPLVDAGAKFVAGTDVPIYPLIPGFSLHRELGLLREMGLTPLQVLQAATRNAAEAMGISDEVGTIEVGKTADLVLLDADPLADVANTSAIRAVITRGRVLDRATLDRLLDDAEALAR